MTAKWIALLLLQLIIGFIEYFKLKPEEVERMSNNERVKAVINFINSGYPGFELPESAKSDKWGTPTAKT